MIRFALGRPKPRLGRPQYCQRLGRSPQVACAQMGAIVELGGADTALNLLAPGWAGTPPADPEPAPVDS